MKNVARAVTRLKYFCAITMAVSTQCLALEFQGVWTQGGLIVGNIAPGAIVHFDNKVVPVTPSGHFVVGLGRDTPPQVALTVERDGAITTHTFKVVQRQYDVQRVDGVPQETVTPPRSVLDRINREAALVSRARAHSASREDFMQGFVRPMEGPITGVYGSQRVYNGTPKNPHFGLDIAGPTGTLVRAPAPGKVKLVHRDMYFSGGTLIVDHGYGVFSTFIHLSDILVKEGDQVQPGDGIARVGATGRATGPHLDWRINWYDVRVDPALVLEYFPARASAHSAPHAATKAPAH